MEELTLTTPAVLFSAISLIMLAYTNRFLAYAAVIRNLHDIYLERKEKSLIRQIKNLKLRLNLTRWMQIFWNFKFTFLCVDHVFNLCSSTKYGRLGFWICFDFIDHFFGIIDQGNTNLCSGIAISYCRY